MNDILSQLSLAGIVPVIALERAEDAVPLCAALREGGLPVVEITLRTEAGIEAIRQVREALPEMLIGAGTVLDSLQADRARQAGARFIVSPGLDPSLVKHCQDRGIPVIPGCATPSEVEQALALGIDTVKFFPAEAMGGIRTIRTIAAPFGMVRFMPTGGINEDNLPDYLGFDRVVACGGSWMAPRDALAARDWPRITALTRSAVNAMLGFELIHIGINGADEAAAGRDARMLAELLGLPVSEGAKSFFAGASFEVMKAPGRGEKGHIGIACNSVDRAVWQLERRGFRFDRDSLRMQGGKMDFIYMEGEIGGFALHLTRKQQGRA